MRWSLQRRIMSLIASAVVERSTMQHRSMSEPTARGCNATGSAPFALLAFALVLLNRRRSALVLASLVAVTFVAPVFAAAVTTEQGWKVEAVHTLPPGRGAAVLESELTLERNGVRQVVRVWGGSWGDIEQVVEAMAVPVVGARVLLGERSSAGIRH